MENASRALIMAGAMLIAILTVSLLVWGWGRISQYNQKSEQVAMVEQITKLNREIESYDKQVVRGYELVSLANLIEDTNSKFPISEGYTPVSALVNFRDFEKSVTNYTAITKAQKNELTSGIELSTFMNEYYNVSKNGGDTSFLKVFKESYFQCDNVEYSDYKEKNNSIAKVKRMTFTEIKRTDK